MAGLSMKSSFAVHFLLIIAFSEVAECSELTFKLLKRSQQCFYEEMEENSIGILLFQVLDEAPSNLDVIIRGPPLLSKVVYQVNKLQEADFSWIVPENGTYSLCFRNFISGYSSKTVYFMFLAHGPGSLTMRSNVPGDFNIDNSISTIHGNLNRIIEQQTHYRLMENIGRNRMENLMRRVSVQSLMSCLSVVITSVLVVCMVKWLFVEKREQIAVRMIHG